jgi:hypothetical protein
MTENNVAVSNKPYSIAKAKLNGNLVEFDYHGKKRRGLVSKFKISSDGGGFVTVELENDVVPYKTFRIEQVEHLTIYP